jgi:conjugal transfer mating pair stabilization protein TraG
LHPSGNALDFRGNNISVAQGEALADGTRRSLPPGYDVIFEQNRNPAKNHLHVEYDPKPRRRK